MPGPILWGPNNVANNLQNNMQMGNGHILSFNGPRNFIPESSYKNGAGNLTWALGTIGTLTNNLPTGTPNFSGTTTGITLSPGTALSPSTGVSCISFLTGATTPQGNMFASPALAVDASTQGKVLTFSFNYQVTAGAANGNWSGTSSNSFAVAFYDITNSSWLPQTANFGMTQSSGIGTCTGTFQTNITTASIAMCVYCANATTGVTVLFDDLYLGSQIVPIGFAGTEWQQYSPTVVGFGTPTSASYWWKRSGDSIHLMGTFIAGTTTATQAQIPLPSGLTISSTKGSGVINLKGKWNTNTGASSVFFDAGTVLATQGNSYIQFGIESSTANALNPANGSAFILSGSALSYFTEEIPVAGWSSNVQMSSDTDTRVISFSGATSGSQAVTANVTNIAAVATLDRSGSWSGTVFTAPISGDYVMVAYTSPTAAAAMQGYQAGVAVPGGLSLGAAGGISTGSIFFPGVTAGQTLALRSNVSTNLASTSISIYRLTGPAVIAATESVNASYTNTAGSTIGTSLGTIPFATKYYDSHNAWSGTQYVVPVSGKYRIGVTLAMTNTVLTTAQVLSLQVIQAGSVSVTKFLDQPAGNGVSQALFAIGTATFNCLAGDTLTIQAFSSVSTTTNTTAGACHFEIERVGN